MIYKYLCLFISMIFPRNSKMFVFGAWLGEKYDDNSRYLYEYVLKNKKDSKVYWITKNAIVYNKLKDKNFPVLMAKSFKAHWVSFRAKFIVTVTGKEDIGKNYF